MYTVLVVDDEAASLKHICNIISMKCSDFQVIDTARNGQIALEKIQEQIPDVIFSDVQMPVMDGIELVSQVKKRYPKVLSVIVSGYNDFEYARGAIASGVCEYILKPVRPSDIVTLMDKLREILVKEYYELRKQMLKQLSMGTVQFDEQRLKRLFPDEQYFAAIYRKNGLPSRFNKGGEVELYSMPQEKIIIYGRDAMEGLYLCPASLMGEGDFLEHFYHVYEKIREPEAFYTVIIQKQAFAPTELSLVLKKLYRSLDENIVIGHNQILSLEDISHLSSHQKKSYSFENLEHYLKAQDDQAVTLEIANLFHYWKVNQISQLSVEEKTRYLLTTLSERGYVEELNDFVLDDLFSEAVSMEELSDSIISLILSQTEHKKSVDSKLSEYEAIMRYIQKHMEEGITVHLICKKFAISQSSLSNLFHRYGNCSFSHQLTMVRMNQAKEVMKQNPQVLIRDVAKQVGYSEQFYFSRVFRSVFGITPSEYLEKINCY